MVGQHRRRDHETSPVRVSEPEIEPRKVGPKVAGWQVGPATSGESLSFSQERWSRVDGLFPEFASTPDPPYYVAVITVRRTDDDDGYYAAAEEMYELASAQRGFLGMEWVADTHARTGITASYWTDAEAIAEWKAQVDHLGIQRLGQERWYESYMVRVALVERQYRWHRPA